MKYILLVGLFILLNISSVIGQHRCHGDIDLTENALTRQWMNQSIDKNYNGQTPVIRLALHNVRKKNGTGGNSWADIRAVVQGIAFFYEPHNICFTVVAERNLDKNAYHNMTSFSDNGIPNPN
jgi:hypothetical protein